jgi:predicted nucleotide-binding protein (sugar kinase/HSP70/actin superfamily)
MPNAIIAAVELVIFIVNAVVPMVADQVLDMAGASVQVKSHVRDGINAALAVATQAIHLTVCGIYSSRFVQGCIHESVVHLGGQAEITLDSYKVNIYNLSKVDAQSPLAAVSVRTIKNMEKEMKEAEALIQKRIEFNKLLVEYPNEIINFGPLW